MFMSSLDYRESLRAFAPRVFCNGEAVGSVSDEPRFRPGIDDVGVTYDFALDPRRRPVMVGTQHTSGRDTNRMLHVNRTSQDLLYKLEAVRALCQEVGCAQRYLTQDGLNALYEATAAIDADDGRSDYHQRFLAYLHEIQERDLTLGIAMTDGKGDRSGRPHSQANPDAYVRIVERRPDGIVIAGAKAIVTGAPYMHGFLVMPCRTMTAEDADWAVSCAVPVDADGLTVIARPAGRPGDAAAKFSAKYGQSTGVLVFDRVFVPWERVFMAGEWHHTESLVRGYANHHRHSCIAARAGFGDLLIGAGVLMAESNGVPAEGTDHIRGSLTELIKIVEGFYACGVAASTSGEALPAGSVRPEPVFSNVGKLLLATQIYEMQRLANEVSGGLIVSLPGPEEDHNPATAGTLADLLAGRSGIPYRRRIEVARLLEDLTASGTAGWYSTISVHGGGSPEAMKREIWRNYPVRDRTALVERLLDRGVLADGKGSRARDRQPGRCCVTGCEVPTPSYEEAAE